MLHYLIVAREPFASFHTVPLSLDRLHHTDAAYLTLSLSVLLGVSPLYFVAVVCHLPKQDVFSRCESIHTKGTGEKRLET